MLKNGNLNQEEMSFFFKYGPTFPELTETDFGVSSRFLAKTQFSRLPQISEHNLRTVRSIGEIYVMLQIYGVPRARPDCPPSRLPYNGASPRCRLSYGASALLH